MGYKNDSFICEQWYDYLRNNLLEDPKDYDEDDYDEDEYASNEEFLERLLEFNELDENEEDF